MKVTRLPAILSLLAIIVMPTACDPGGGADCVLSANTENISKGRAVSMSRSETTDYLTVNWAEGDQIKVYRAADIKVNESQGLDFTLTGSAGTPAAQFTAPGSSAYSKGNLYAVYPAGIVKKHEGTVVTVELPSEQRHRANTFSPEHFPSISSGSAREAMAFTNLCGLLIVKLTDPSENTLITSLTLTTADEEALWGEGTVDLETNGLIPSLKMAAPASAAQKSMKLTCNPPVQLTGTATSFCFTLPAGALSKGMTLAVNDDFYGPMTLNAAAGKVTISRSVCRTSELAYSYSVSAINPDTELKGLAVGFSSASMVQIPQITGTNNGWQVYWGDGTHENYAPGMTHTYANGSDKVAVLFNTESAESYTFNSLYGVNALYFLTR